MLPNWPFQDQGAAQSAARPASLCEGYQIRGMPPAGALKLRGRRRADIHGFDFSIPLRAVRTLGYLRTMDYFAFVAALALCLLLVVGAIIWGVVWLIQRSKRNV